MKSVYIESAHNVFIKDLPQPVRQENSVLIKVKAASICGSDVSAYRGTDLIGVFPRVLGHEIAGEVVEASDNHPTIRVGERVVVEPYIYCGSCYPCRNGRTNSCLRLSVIGVFENGGMSEYMSHPASLVHKVPNNLPWEQAVLAEPLTIALHAIHRAGLKAEERVAITGAGPIGILVALAAKVYGAVPILIDILPDRLGIAQQLGIQFTINSAVDDPVQKIKDWTDGGLAEVVIEASGAEAVIRNTINFVRHTGRIVLVGWPKNPELLFPTMLVTRKELDVRGAKNSAGEFPEAITLLTEGLVTVTPLISKTVTMDEAPQAIKDQAEHPEQYLKMVILL